MTVFDALTKLTGGLDKMVAFLERVKTTTPDLAPQADEFLGKLGAAVTPENLMLLAAALPPEFQNIIKGDFRGQSHPSDAI